MESVRWQLVEQYFHELVDRPHTEQVSALRDLTTRDASLADEVRAMIEADLSGQTLLHRQPGAVAQAVLTESSLMNAEFGPYRITALLGEGGMGVVYLGWRADLNSSAAIKVLREAWLSPSRRERFLAEQRTLASLEHDGIARLLDADRLPDGTPWFAMEYVDGVTITDYCQQQNLSLSARLALFSQVVDAVRFAHERGVLHRDIKPSNVQVSREGKVKLLDFGIAKTLRANDGSVDPTRTQHRMLTPAYAAPEQLRGHASGVQSDVFSLGVLLYEMLSGVRPYRVEELGVQDAAAFIEARPAARVTNACQGRETAVALHGLSGGVRADLDALLACAIHADPARRYRSADALLSDLARYANNQPLAARPDSVTYRTQKFLARNWRAVAVATLTVVALVSTNVAYTLRIAAARETAEAEAARVGHLKDFLVSLFDGGDVAAGPSDAIRVSDVIKRGIKESRARTGDPKLQAELFGVLGYAAGRLGEPAVADSLLHDALRLKRSINGEDSPSAVEAAVTLASHLNYIGQTDSALRIFRAADSTARRSLPEMEPARALVAEQYGYALAEADSLTQGMPLMEEAVRLRALVDSTSTEYGDALSTLANAAYYTQEFARAESLNLSVIRLTERNLGPKHPSLWVNYANLGNIAMSDGRYREHEQWARKALALTESYYGEDDYRTARALKSLGQSLLNQDKIKDAQPLLARALAIQERVMGPNSAAVGSALSALASVEAELGHDSVALRMYERGTNLFAKLYGAEHKNTLLMLAYQATLHLRAGRVDTADALGSRAVRIAERTMPPHFQELALLRLRLGRVRFAQKRYREAIDFALAGLAAFDNTSGPNNFSRGARNDLRKAYLALGDTTSAARYTDSEAKAPATKGDSKAR